MRVALVSSLIVLFACGGAAQKPAETSADTPEPSGSSTAPEPSASSAAAQDMPAAAADTAAPAPKPAAAAEAAAPPAAFHPTPSVTGAIDGKPFAPKIAKILSPAHKDGRVVVTLTEGTTCDAQPGEAALSITVAWKNGYKTDLGSLKRASKKKANEIGVSRPGASNKAEFSTTFKPSGTLTVVSAPTAKGATGKINVDLQSGGYILAGDLDALVCTSLE